MDALIASDAEFSEIPEAFVKKGRPFDIIQRSKSNRSHIVLNHGGDVISLRSDGLAKRSAGFFCH